MDIEIARWNDLRPQPWKNGGGVTYELALGPQRADAASFDWRVSIAEVASDGPFSIFEGVDRTLVLLDGRGVELVVDGHSTALSAAQPRLSFAGSAQTYARLFDGPVRDLNVMTRGSRLGHRVVAQGTGLLVPFSENWMLLAIEDTTVTLNDRQVSLATFDLLQVCGEPRGARVAGRCWLVELFPAGAKTVHLDKYV